MHIMVNTDVDSVTRRVDDAPPTSGEENAAVSAGRSVNHERNSHGNEILL